MADRLQYTPPSIYTERAAEISYDDGTTSFLNELSGAFLGVAQKAHQNELRANVDQAQKEGLLAGVTQGASFKPSKGKGLVHRTYNDSAIQAATVKMSLASQSAIQRIAAENPGNPGAQAQSYEKWADAFAAELPQEMIAPFRQSFDQMASSALTTANRDLAEIRQSEAVSSFNDFEMSMFNSIEMFAPRMFDEGAVGTDNSRSIEMIRQHYAEALVKNGPGAAYNVGGYSVPEGSGRSNAFSVEQIGQKLEDFDKKVLSSAVKGHFIQELEAGRGVGAYFNWVKGNTTLTTVDENGEITNKALDDTLNNEDKEKIASFMRTHISTLNSIEAAEDRKADRARDKYNESIIDTALSLSFETTELEDGTEVVQGQPEIIRKLYLEAVNDESGLVRPETIETLQGMMETIGTGDIEDPTISSKTKLGIIQRNITSGAQLPEAGLGDKARGEAIQMIRKINAGEHWSNSQRYQTMLHLGKATLAPEAATGILSFGDPNKESAADYAEFQERLMNEVLAAEQFGNLPADLNARPGEGEFDIQAAAQDIMQDIKKRRDEGDKDPELDAVNSKIEAQQAIINDPNSSKKEKAAARDEWKRLGEEKRVIQQRGLFGD